MKNNQWEVRVANHSVEWEWFSQRWSAADVRRLVAERLGHHQFTLRVVCTL